MTGKTYPCTVTQKTAVLTPTTTRTLNPSCLELLGKTRQRTTFTTREVFIKTKYGEAMIQEYGHQQNTDEYGLTVEGGGQGEKGRNVHSPAVRYKCCLISELRHHEWRCRSPTHRKLCDRRCTSRLLRFRWTSDDKTSPCCNITRAPVSYSMNIWWQFLAIP